MATNSNQALLSTLFFALIFLNFPATIRPDNPCPYPCYPPPTGPGNTPTTPAATIPPPPPSQTVSYYPPPAGYNPPTPTGNLPYYTPPPPLGSNVFGAPPPPDPILPYFPFYFKEPLHGQGQSSATSLGRPIWVMIAMANLLVSIFLFSSYV